MRQCLKKHIFNPLYDCDASVQAALRENVSYQISNLNCCVHLRRIVRRMLFNIRKTENAETRRTMEPLQQKVITNLLAAIKHNQEIKNVESMEKDHCLGNHQNCQAYYCKESKVDELPKSYFYIAEKVL
jgi:hypothetical protein